MIADQTMKEDNVADNDRIATVVCEEMLKVRVSHYSAYRILCSTYLMRKFARQTGPLTVSVNADL